MYKVLNHIDVLIKELNSDKIKQSEVKLKLFTNKVVIQRKWVCSHEYAMFGNK